MNETGIISAINGEKAVVLLNRAEKCEGCHVCSAFGENKMQVEALNRIGAQVGDQVDVAVEPKQVIKGSLIIFIFPLAMMIAGYYVAIRLLAPHSEGVGILGSLSALGLSFLLIKWTDSRRNPDAASPAVIVNVHKF